MNNFKMQVRRFLVGREVRCWTSLPNRGGYGAGKIKHRNFPSFEDRIQVVLQYAMLMCIFKQWEFCFFRQIMCLISGFNFITLLERRLFLDEQMKEVFLIQILWGNVYNPQESELMLPSLMLVPFQVKLSPKYYPNSSNPTGQVDCP